MTSEPASLAIVGIGCLFPGGGTSPAAFWANVRAGVDAIREVPPTHWRPEDYQDADPKAPDRVYTVRGGFLDPVPFNPAAFGIPPTSLEATDTSQLLGLVVAQQALLDAGYQVGSEEQPGLRPLDRRRVSVLLGVTGTLELVVPLGARLGHPRWRQALRDAGVDEAVAQDVVARISDSYVPWQENSFPGLLGNVVAGRIANKLDLGGTNCVVDAACASSLSALHLAALELRSGKADVVLSGGVDTFNDIFMYMCFSKTPALSPSGDARPFDAAGDGTILGEGLGLVVLKRLADAERDGDRIYAILRGIGTSSDGRGGAVYAPRPEGQVAALRDAYEQAGVSPDTIELVEAHGTGTRVGDATEVQALTQVYGASGRKGRWCAVGSIKSQIGHTKAAAGAAGLIKAALALYHKVLPPTVKVSRPLEVLADEASPFYVNTSPRPWLAVPEHPRRAGVSAFGFGGSNFHAVLEEAGPEKPRADWADGRVQVLTFSGATAASLAEQLAGIETGDLRTVAAASRAAFRSAAPQRLALVIERGVTDVAKLLGVVRERLAKQPEASWRVEGACHGVGPRGKLAVLFSGQGAQYPGMLRDLVCGFAAAQDELARAAAAFGGGLAECLYPLVAFTPEERSSNEDRLRATALAQPALGAVSLGAYRVLEALGLRADAVAGHSFGELTALCAAGRLDAEDFHTLAVARGRCMASAGEAGTMLAVHAGPDAILPVLDREQIALTLANKNAPAQTVLSGTVALIERAEAALGRAGLRCQRLPVGGAFHSPLVAGAATAFAAALRRVRWWPGALPVYANVSATLYPDDPVEFLSAQIASPVEFVRQIAAMHAVGLHDYLEVGPGGRLVGLVDAILQEQPHDAFALDAARGNRSGLYDLAGVVAWLAARGHVVDLTTWDAGWTPPRADKKPALVVPLVGANYVTPRPARPARSAQPRPHTPQAPMHEPTPNPAVTTALQLARESLAALQTMQEQTARLHQQFLEGQETAQRSVQTLIEQQQHLMQAALGLVGVRVEEARQPVKPTPVKLPPVTPTPTTLTPVQPVRPAVPEVRREPVVPAPAPLTPIPLPSPSPPVSTRGERGAGALAPILLAVVAEKTGYPAEMLDLDMTLDADLGIDSIKRVEILSALQERVPDAPAVKPEHLGTLHTLRQIVEHLEGSDTPATVAPANDLAPILLAVVAEKTGYPAEMLDLDMTLDADLGIDSIKRVEILSALQERVPDAPAVKPEHLGTLHTLRQIVEHLGAGPATPTPVVAPTTPVVPTALRRSVLRTVPVPAGRAALKLPHGDIVLTADDAELSAALARHLEERGHVVRRLPLARLPHEKLAGQVAALVLVAPQDGVGTNYLRDALFAVQQHGRAAGRIATVARLDGAFGVRNLAADHDALDGGLAGLTKTAAHEWPGVSCRAFDIAPDVATEKAAAWLADELLLTGPLETGLSASGATALELVYAAQPAPGPLPLQVGEVVVVSGGGRGVTAEVAVALARAARPTLVLLGRTRLGEESADLAALATEADLKRVLATLRPGVTPRALGDEVARILAWREIRRTLARCAEAGAQAIYHAVDVDDVRAVEAIFQEVTAAYGPVRGIIHGAGVLADAKIEDKTPAQFEQVIAPKIGGWSSLRACCDHAALRFVVLFSSTTARLGRRGQVDYAMANEVLNKEARRFAREYPSCRVLSVGWGPWDGGMVTPGLRKVFEQEGVGLIPLAEGAAWLVRELANPEPSPVEVVVLVGATSTVAPGVEVPGSPDLPVAFTRRIDVESHPVLVGHVLDDRPVLPLAVTLEYMGHAALHQNAGLHFHGCNDLRVLHGVTLDEGPRTIELRAGKARKIDGGYLASVEMRSRRGDGRPVLHARAEVLLVGSLPAAPPSVAPLALPAYPHTTEEVYQDFLFHGPELVAIEAVEGCGPGGIVARLRPAPLPAAWLTSPLRPRWLADPLVLDGVFQLMILWSRQQHQSPSLPCRVGRYRQYRRAFPEEIVRAQLAVRRQTGSQAFAEVELTTLRGELIARLEEVEVVLDPALQMAFERNRLPDPARG